MATQANEVAPTAVKGSKKAKAPKAPVTGPVIKLADKKAEYKDGSARALWLAAVRKYNGKSVEVCVEALTKTPPVLTKSGKGEPPAGWLRYFQREGLIQIAQ
jgi:hypothetical protein